MMVDVPVFTTFLLIAGMAAASGKRIKLEQTVRSNLPFSDAVWHGDDALSSRPHRDGPENWKAGRDAGRGGAAGDEWREADARGCRPDHG